MLKQVWQSLLIGTKCFTKVYKFKSPITGKQEHILNIPKYELFNPPIHACPNN